MIDKQKFQDVKDQAVTAMSAVATLEELALFADPQNTQGGILDDAHSYLVDVMEWANAAIEQANQEEQQAVMNNFLAELRVVFDKYTASAEATQFESGYGTNYGEPGLGFILTASFDGVSSTKELKKSVIAGSDLV
jgi:hypothetical protein